MIALGSKSYPYLSVAHHYGIEYGEVLKFIEWLENTNNLEKYDILGWRLMAYVLYKDEHERRQQVWECSQAV